MKEKFLSIIGPGIISLIVSGICAAGNLWLTSERMTARIATLEKDVARHELAKEKEFGKLSVKTDDHEQRLVKLETNLGAIQTTLKELRADVKELLHLRGGRTIQQ